MKKKIISETNKMPTAHIHVSEVFERGWWKGIQYNPYENKTYAFRKKINLMDSGRSVDFKLLQEFWCWFEKVKHHSQGKFE